MLVLVVTVLVVMEVLVVVGAILMMLAVEFFNRKTIYGKAVVATFNDRDAAKLMGINTALVITFSYALSSATAGFAGALIAARKCPSRWRRKRPTTKNRW